MAQAESPKLNAQVSTGNVRNKKEENKNFKLPAQKKKIKQGCIDVQMSDIRAKDVPRDEQGIVEPQDQP